MQKLLGRAPGLNFAFEPTIKVPFQTFRLLANPPILSTRAHAAQAQAFSEECDIYEIYLYLIRPPIATPPACRFSATAAFPARLHHRSGVAAEVLLEYHLGRRWTIARRSVTVGYQAKFISAVSLDKKGLFPWHNSFIC